MMIIKFSDGTDWYKPNWIFKQFAEDAELAFPNEPALILVLERAQAVGGLFLDSVDAESVTSTLEAMRKVAEDTIQGNIQGWKRTRPGDKKGQQMYLESVAELLDLFRKQAHAA